MLCEEAALSIRFSHEVRSCVSKNPSGVGIRALIVTAHYL